MIKIKYFTLIFFVSNIYCYVLDKDNDYIYNFLESANFNEALQNINKSTNPEKRNYYLSLYSLFNYEFDTAENYITKVSTSSEKINFFKNYISKLNDILKQDYLTFETEHFIIMVKGRDLVLKDILSSKLEKIYNFYKNIFDFHLDKKVMVQVFNTKDEFAFASTLGLDTIKEKGVVGICKFNRVMILSCENLYFGYRWIDTLAHEYIHLILNRKTNYNLPLYLHEGIARYFDTLYRSTYSLSLTDSKLELLYSKVLEDKLIEFEKIKGSLVYLDSQQDIELAFTELAMFIHYLIENYGTEKLIEFIGYFANVKNENEVYNVMFKVPYENLISNWVKRIKSDARYFTSFNSGASLDLRVFDSGDEFNMISLDIEEYIKLGDRLKQMGKLNSALYQYKNAIKLKPKNPVALNRVARLYVDLSNLEEAQKHALECISANPNYVGGYETLFEIYYKQGNYINALQTYNDILEINPFNYIIRKKVAEIYSDLGKLENALDEYRKIKLLQPDDLEINNRINIIEHYLDQKKPKK